MTAAVVTGTFDRVPCLAWELSATQRDILHALLRYCGNRPVCWPGQRALAALAKRSLTTVNRVLDELRRRGVIAIEHRHGHETNRYRIAAGYWIPCKRKEGTASSPKNSSISAGCSAGVTDSDSQPSFKKEPPRTPPQAEGN